MHPIEEAFKETFSSLIAIPLIEPEENKYQLHLKVHHNIT